MSKSNSAAAFFEAQHRNIFHFLPCLAQYRRVIKDILSFNFDSNPFIEFLCFIKEQDVSIAGVEKLSCGCDHWAGLFPYTLQPIVLLMSNMHPTACLKRSLVALLG